MTLKQRILLFLGVVKLGCKYCAIHGDKDVTFRSERKLLEHMDNCPFYLENVKKESLRKPKKNLKSLIN